LLPIVLLAELPSFSRGGGGLLFCRYEEEAEAEAA